MGKVKKHREHTKNKSEESKKKELPPPVDPLPFLWYKIQEPEKPTQKEEPEVIREGELIRLSSKSKTPHEYHVILTAEGLICESLSPSKENIKVIFTPDTTVEEAESTTISVIVPKEKTHKSKKDKKKKKKKNSNESDEDDDDDKEEDEDNDDDETSSDDDSDDSDDDDDDDDKEEDEDNDDDETSSEEDSDSSDEESEEEKDIEFYGFKINEKEETVITLYTNEDKDIQKWISKIEKCLNGTQASSSSSSPELSRSSDTERTELDIQTVEKFGNISLKDIEEYKEKNNVKEIQAYVSSYLSGDEVKFTWRAFDQHDVPCRIVITRYRIIVASDDSPVTMLFNQHILNLSTVKLEPSEIVLERRRPRSPSGSTPSLSASGYHSTSPLLSNNVESIRVKTSSSIQIAYEIFRTLKTISLKKNWPKLTHLHKGKEEKLNWEDILIISSKNINEEELNKKLVNLYLSHCCMVERVPNRAIRDYLDYYVKTSSSELDFTQCAFGASGYEDAAVALDALKGLSCFKGVVVVGPGHTAKGTSATVARALTDFVESTISSLTRVVARSIAMDEREAAAFGEALKRSGKEHELCDVSFADNPIRDNGLYSIITNLLPNTASLRCINISGCGISPKGFKAFFAALKKNKDISIFVRELYLTDNRLEDSGSAALNEWITEFPEGTLSLRKLAIANTKPNFELLPALKTVSLELLDISWNQISPKACVALGNAAVNASRFVANGCTIQGKNLEAVLNKFFSRSDKPKLFECSGTNAPFLPAVSSVLAKMPKNSITRLSLTGTTFSRDGFLGLASGIIMCESLYELDLSSPVFDLPSTIRGNEFSWAQSLAAIVAECGSLTTVDLSRGYGSLVITKFLEIISKNRKYALRLLDISGNEIGDRGAAAIAGFLKSGGPLMGLVYGNNNITANGFLTIAAEIVTNKSILMLDSGSRRGLTGGIGGGFTNGSTLGSTNSSNSSGGMISINVVANGDDAGNLEDDPRGFQGLGMKNILRSERVISNVILRNIKRLKNDYSKVPLQLKNLLALGEDQYNPWTSSLSEDYEPYLVNPPLKTSPKVHK